MYLSRQHTKHLFECPSVTGSDDDASAVYYWIRRMTARRCAVMTPNTKTTPRATAPDPASPTGQAKDSDDTGDEADQHADVLIGCLKYGGSCDQCQPTQRDQKHSDTTTDAFRVDVELPLPPLILALRVCSRAAGARLSERSPIVEMLLASGAHPDGSVDASDDSSGDPIGLSSPFYALLGAVRTGQPSLIYTLLSHGATRLNFQCLKRYCSTDWSVETLENLLSSLASLSGATESKTFTSMLFTNKCFSLLSRVIDASLSAEQTDKRSVWRVILHHLEASMPRRRQRPCERGALVDKDHLRFLCRVADDTRLPATAKAERNTSTTEDMAVQEEATSSMTVDGLAELIKFCVCHRLKDSARPSNRSRYCMSADDHNVDEAAVIHCIRHLSSARDSVSGESAWFEQMIACGFFRSATMVLEARLVSGNSQVSLDGIFRAFEKGTRRLNRVDAANSGGHAKDFLCVWLGKLLFQNRDTPSALASNVTMRSVVYACAHNLPLRLIERYLELATTGCCDRDHQVTEAMKAMKATHVNGKRLEQWLVLHRRLDVIHAVFRLVFRTSQSAWGFWRELMSTGVVSLPTPKLELHEEDAESTQKWISELFALPSISEVMSSSSEEFEFETLEWFVIHRVVPADCEQMMEMLLPRIRELEQQRAMTKADDDAEREIETENTSLSARKGADALRQWCSRTRLVYACARWNATRVLTCTLEAIRAESQDEDVKVWFTDIASRANAVDEYSPVVIVRLLGHLSMRRALVTLSSLSTPSCGSEPFHEPSQVANRDADGCPDDDSEEDTHILESSRTFGYLRAVLAAHELIASTVPTHTPTCTPTASLTTSVVPPSHHYFAAPSVSEDLETVCRSNRVHHLAILTDLLSTSAVATTLDGQLLGRLALTAVANGALDALKWLLSAYSAASLTEDDSNACVQLAARRMTGGGGGAFVEMLPLLLDHSFPPGRLAGDGGEITILHRAACVGNPLLARRVITRVLAIEGCDVNVLDPHGNTPVVYALASGRLENACFLMQHANCRLEAEYEGQACFYYALNLVPSLPARRIVKALLMTERAHAFLHCDADSGACACKSFEVSVASGGGSGEVQWSCDAVPLRPAAPVMVPRSVRHVR